MDLLKNFLFMSFSAFIFALPYHLTRAFILSRLGYCKLCEALHANRPIKTIENVENWFFGTSQCEKSEFAESWKEE